MIAASMIVSILLLQQPFWAAAAAFLCLPADTTLQCCSHLWLKQLCSSHFLAAASCSSSLFVFADIAIQYIVLQPSIPKAAVLWAAAAAILCLQQQPLWVYKHIYIVLQPFMAQAAVIVGCSSSFKWRQEYIMAAESEVAVRRGSYRNTRSHYCAAKWQKQLHFNNC